MKDDVENLEKAFSEGDFELIDELLPSLLAQDNPAAIRINASFCGDDVSEAEFEQLYKDGMFKAAALGDLEAKYQVGVFYDHGEYDVPLDKVKASEIFKELALLGDSHCAWIYSCELIGGEGSFPLDLKKGIELLERAVVLGSSEACITLASFYDEGKFGYEVNKEIRDNYREKALELDESTIDPYA